MNEYIVDMWSHYFTLRAHARELDESLRGARIAEIFSQQKDEIIVTTLHHAGERSLTISVNPQMNFILLRERLARARRNSIDLFPDAIATCITRISDHDEERVLFIDTDKSLKFCIHMFGSAASNVLLVNHEMVICNAFKKRKQLVGKPYELPAPRTSRSFLENPHQFHARLSMNPSSPVYSALKSLLPRLGSTFVREALHRAGVEERRDVDDLTPDESEALHGAILQIHDEADHPRPTVYLREGEPRVFSVVPLHHLSGSRTETFPSVNEAIRILLSRAFRTRAVDSVKKALLRKLKGEHDRTARSLRAAQVELKESSRAEEYDRVGKILMANLQHLTKGTKVVELEDVFADGKPVRITLDPKLPPARNAERYFDKAKKARTARKEIEERARHLENKLSLLDKLLLHLDNCQTKEQLAEFQTTHEAVLREFRLLPAGAQVEQPPFRVFTVHGGFEVWVGKSSASNDTLTMKYAKPNDLWFHARGASGSHVVLKVGTGDGKATAKEAIHQAASIAAYYSKMRNAKNVPVAYCERKYIRKPKGSNPGTVVMEREKVVFVEPSLPT